LPDFKEVFFFPHFDLLPEVLPDAPAHQDTKPAGHAREISEMVMVNAGTRDQKMVYLVVCQSPGSAPLVDDEYDRAL
jgi:cleavage and polyadenylation specificity factor subunit 1